MRQEVQTILERTGALMRGHFVLTSSRHADAYFNKDALYPHVRDTKSLCQLLTAGVLDSGLGRLTQVVAAPEKGGIILSQWMAYLLNSYTPHDEVLAVYAEKEGDKFTFRRGYDKHLQGKQVLVVEDVLTTGGSAKKTAEAVRSADGEVLAVACLWNRGGITAEALGVPELISLIKAELVSWGESECPLCRQGMSVNIEVGHGQEFLAGKGAKASVRFEAFEDPDTKETLYRPVP